LPSLLTHQAHPGIELALTEDSSNQMIDKVRSGLLDLALVGCAEAPPTGLGVDTEIFARPALAR